MPGGLRGLGDCSLERAVEGQPLNPKAYRKACELVDADPKLGMDRDELEQFYALPEAAGQLERAFVRALLVTAGKGAHQPDWSSPMASWPKNQWKQPMAGRPPHTPSGGTRQRFWRS